VTLKEYRLQQNMTQRDLQMHSGVSIRTIREIENHKRLIGSVTVNTAVKLAMALGITVEDLTGKIMDVEGKLYFENDFEWFKPNEAGE
jgi:transcriptional regulator with XRE-family HTH domain